MRRQAAIGQPDRAMHPQSLELEQTAKLLERFADNCAVPVPSRPNLDIVKARTPDYALPLAVRSNAGNHGGQAELLKF